MIPYGSQNIDEDDINEVIKTLKSSHLTQGPKVLEFEKFIADYCGAKYAVACSNGTSALHLAYLASELGSGDEVITTPNTFVATTNMLLAIGAKPIFCDIRLDSYNINEENIEKIITTKTKAIIPVHFAGHSCEMDKINEIAKKYNLVVIEDACHALGARYKNRKIGSISDMTIFSFHPVKPITTGEGGIITTNNENFYNKLISLRSHGIHKDENGKNVMTELGYNYRITDIQASLGVSQLRKLDNFIQKRHEVFEWYKEELEDEKNIILPTELLYNYSGWHIYVIRTKNTEDRDGLMGYLKDNGVGVNFHYPAVYSHPYYKENGYGNLKLKNTEEYHNSCVTLPCHAKLKREDVKYIADKIKDFYRKKLKILIINVCLRPYRKQILFPLGISYIVRAIHNQGYDMELLDLDRDRKTDEEIEDFLKTKDFDVIAFGSIVTGYKIVKNLSKIIRGVKKDAIIIAGNSVADSIPEILLKKTEVDVAVIGEGDETIVKVLSKLNESKKIKSLKDVKGIWYKDKEEIFKNESRDVIKDISSIPFPMWELFDIEAYIKSSSDLLADPLPMPKEQIRTFRINTARGCPYRCSFCYQVFQKSGYRRRSIDSIILEIKELQKRYGINYIEFSDDLCFPTKDNIEKFVDRVLLENLKFYWTASCRSDLFNSEDDIQLLAKIKQAGCLGFGYSLESANIEILKSMNKMLNKDNFIKQKKILDKAGLMSYTSLVLGYPQETKETIKETMDLCYDLGIYPSCGYLLPQPGTPMYDYIFENGIVSNEEEYLLSLGDRQDLRINLTKMSDDEFKEEVKNNLMRISKKLELNFEEKKLLKTENYKASKSE
ncbi:MAG: UDP-4-amino-4,6-dideoxy-N-acetyl-beta-L-altrosamine transaminase [Candidatus Falkowbacteria bacterium]